MQQSPHRLSSKKSRNQSVAKDRLASSAQHVSHRQHLNSSTLYSSLQSEGSAGASTLESLPYETLCHVTSYLDPPSLASFSAVNRRLHAALNDDVVWKLALFTNFLGISPEREHESPRAFLLRRSEPTWKSEYITRYNLLLRWSESKTTSIAHSPLRWPVPNIHMLSDGNSLLVAPEHFTWVLRSIPSTGKVIKGHFQPTLVNQAHPTSDWNPPSAATMASDCQLAKIAWASQSGHVMVKTAQKAMDVKANRNISSVVSTRDDGPHEGMVNHISWAVPRGTPSNLDYIITASEDGCVKIWIASTCTALWTSTYAHDAIPFVRAELDIISKTAYALSEDGNIVAWSPIPFPTPLLRESTPQSPSETRMLTHRIPSNDGHQRVYKASSTLLLDHTVTTTAIVHVREEPCAWHFCAKFDEEVMEMVKITGPLGAITALHLELPTKPSEPSILMIGDSLSQLSIYDMGTGRNITTETVSEETLDVQAPNITLAAHEFGAITAIDSNNVVILTGNDMGIVNVWNAITLTAVRTINCTDLAKGTVGVLNLIARKENVVASIGKYIMHWRTGMMPTKNKRPQKKIKSTKAKPREVDYELAIKESQAELELANKRPSPTVFSEQDQLAALTELGLDEAGAVEYALILSHEEALRAGVSTEPPLVNPIPSSPNLGGVNTDDNSVANTTNELSVDTMHLDEESTSHSPGTQSLSPSARSWSSSYKGVRENFMPSSPWKSISMAKFSPPDPIGKVQISPPYRPEPLEVGPTSSSSSQCSVKLASDNGSENGDSRKGKESFPALSPATGAKPSCSSALPSTITSPPVKSMIDASKSPAWGTDKPASWSQVAKPASAGPSWSNVVKTSMPSVDLKGRGWSGQTSVHTARSGGASKNDIRDDEERELQFVLELSRAEALSRGEA